MSVFIVYFDYIVDLNFLVGLFVQVIGNVGFQIYCNCWMGCVFGWFCVRSKVVVIYFDCIGLFLEIIFGIGMCFLIWLIGGKEFKYYFVCFVGVFGCCIDYYIVGGCLNVGCSQGVFFFDIDYVGVVIVV